MLRRNFFLLCVTALASGSAGYFSFPVEPVAWLIWLIAPFIVVTIALIYIGYGRWHPLSQIGQVLCFVMIGFLWAQGATLRIGETVGQGPVFDPTPNRLTRLDFSGMVIWSEARSRGAQVLVQVAEDKQPPYILRLYAKGEAATVLLPGCHARFRVRLKPIDGTLMPGGYDPRLRAYFEAVRGQGFIRQFSNTDCTRPLTHGQRFDRLRLRLAAAFQDQLEPPLGGLATALVVGARGAVPPATRQLFRDSGLAHMLAISGLHMALFAGSVFAACRFLGACWPWFVQRYDVRRVSALLALLAACFYLMLSGAGYAAQRAFVMIFIFFLAVLLGRAALTLRNLAWAGLVVLALQPHAILQAGFQMSFAAVMALIVFYDVWRQRDQYHVHYEAAKWWQRGGVIVRRYFWGLVMTSFIAGSVTGFIALYHFRYIGTLGLLTNLLTMPIFATLVMPMAVVSVVVMPFGLSAIPMQIMASGLVQIIALAEWVTSWEGAVVPIAASPLWVLPCAGAGFLVFCLSHERWRWLGTLPILLGVLMLGRAEQPLLVIDAHGGTIILREVNGPPSLIRARRGTYQARRIASHMGHQKLRSDIKGVCNKGACLHDMANGQQLALVFAQSGFSHACREAALVVAPFAVPRYPCRATVINKNKLVIHKRLTIYEKNAGLHIVVPEKRDRLWLF